MLDLSSYAFSALREGGLTLYRGSGGGLDPILLVAPVGKYSPRESLKRLEHEYALRDALDAQWAARPTELALRDGRITLVLQDPGGELLDRMLGPPMEVELFLRIAVPLAGAIARMHGRGLIHKDLTPSNILMDVASGGVWLTGFGIASRVPREHHLGEPPAVIAGTLAYMAPEQTGRMNRSVDSRSDLYSLGVMFYQMLTGALPFTATDPMEWVHCHVARQPVAPHERVPRIPRRLSAIVMKLLAKTPEGRYQTAAGLSFDLRRCVSDGDALDGVGAFPLGAHDVPDRLVIPEKLYGREREIDALVASFERVVAAGVPELVLVSGYSGIGKSSVVNELHKVLVPPRGFFASGKFDQYKRDVPYATLAQAFRSLVHMLLGQSDVELDRWRHALREAVGQNGQLIVNLVPELELVLGTQPPVAELPPRDARNRFQLTFRRFLGAFARNEHPLVLFLDDLQWLDAATLDLLEHLLTHSEVQHLLLVGAYRDNEVGPAHPLLRTIETIRRSDTRVHQIALAPLGLDDVGRLVADALRCSPQPAQPLAQLVYEKTAGNPFFAIQFFTELGQDGLLAFDPVVAAWRWDIDRIRARNYTDNVVDLMAGKLKRLSGTTLEALKQLACLGNSSETATLSLVLETPEAAVHAALAEAVYAGLVLHQGSAYQFLHDRIQQAAYTLIPEESRAEAHVHIGRVLVTSLTREELAEHLFNVANQFNRGGALLIDRDERVQVATIDLRAGRKAKASTAYASARAYLAAGIALLDEGDWDSHYQLTFGLWLERAECEFLSGHFETAEHLIEQLLSRAGSNVDRAAVYRLKVQFHLVKSDNAQAVACALTCLRLFGIDLPAHPTPAQVQAEIDAIDHALSGRPIESLLDLPLMSDSELQTAMQVLSDLTPSAYLTDYRLSCVQLCRMVQISLQHGISGASAHGFGHWGTLLGPVFHRYGDAHRFAKLACSLVEKHGFVAYQARIHYAMGSVALWTEPVTRAIEFNRASFPGAVETGDLTLACYSLIGTVIGLLLRNDPLEVVRHEVEMALAFSREAKYSDAVDILGSLQRFIATMEGRPATLEAQPAADRSPLVISSHWLVELKARFLFGDCAGALAAADNLKPLVPGAAGQIQLLYYFYYTALTVSALYENAPADTQRAWRELLAAHREQLREWAENYPPTFADKHVLVSAEIARLDGRDLDAMHLYETAIRSAHEHGFIQYEAVCYEVAARFYAARGFETTAHAYLRSARNCYRRWGADGKVRQLDESYPQLREDSSPPHPTTTIEASLEHLDLATVIKVSHAVSSEIVPEKAIDTLMRTALEHAGAERGLLILSRGSEQRIEAEAITGSDAIAVQLRRAGVTSADLPESVLQHVVRTKESVLLDDASALNPFSADEYVRRNRVRSVLCLPLTKQARLIGVLYLENNLTPRAFTPARIAVLTLLASQAALSLENTRLFSDLQEREARLRRLVDSKIIGILISELDGDVIDANDAFLEMVGYDRDDLVSGRVRWLEMTPPEWLEASQRAVAQMRTTGSCEPFEKEYVRKDGSRVPVLVGAAALEGSPEQSVAFVLDLTERKRAEQALEDLAGRLIRAQEEERNRIGRELHDHISQTLGLLTIKIDQLRANRAITPDIDRALDELRRDTSDITDDVHRLSHRLHSSTLDYLGLVPALQKLVTEFSERHNIAIAFIHASVPPSLPPEVALCLFRVAEESLTNIAKHSQAQSATVQVTGEPDGIHLTVEDAGTGFDMPALRTKAGLGFVSMRERLRVVHGTLQVDSAPSQGTRIDAWVPPMIVTSAHTHHETTPDPAGRRS